MENLLLVLGALFIGLIVMVNLAKMFGPSNDSPNIRKLGRWIIPLLMISLILQILRHYFG